MIANQTKAMHATPGILDITTELPSNDKNKLNHGVDQRYLSNEIIKYSLITWYFTQISMCNRITEL